MYRRFHDRFGTAGVVIAVIALIAALGGTAIAAGGLTSTQKKEVTKIAKKYAGKQGSQGLPGTNGTNGKDGAPGAPGKDGTDGSAGESVDVNSYTGAECEGEGEEGAEFTNGTGTAYACNGEEGSPWTAGGTLPSEKTETGAWEIVTPPGGEGLTTISFPIPLAAEIDLDHQVGLLKGAMAPAVCNDGEGEAPSPANPEADPGYLCVFTTDETGEGLIFNANKVGTPGPGLAQGASKAGARLFYFDLFEEANKVAYGTFAVTAP